MPSLPPLPITPPADSPLVRATKLATALLALALLALALLTALHTDLGPLTATPLLPTLSLTFVFTLALRVTLWLRYRPTPPASPDALPTLTVVVPAYNEGPGVARTLESLLASAYPRDRLCVIAVNDGSRDDTGPALDATQARLADPRLTVLHHPQNRGKRHALYTGFSHAQTDLIATVDSDSIVTPDTLAALVAPLAASPRTAAVAGRVLVWNRAQNLLTRMLHVRYIIGFDFVRAYQSVLGTVWCCPGALQAYRRAVVAPHLDAWRDQRFLGKACTNGDDHALTNLVLSLGYDAVYQATAPVYTLVPTTYAKLCKMYLRWGRSATRESLRALAFTWRRARARSPLVGCAIALDALTQPIALTLRLASFLAGTALLLLSPLVLLKALLAATLFSIPYALVYLRSERSSDVLFGILYGWFAATGLIWVQPLATLTVRKNGWLTRG